MAPSAPHTLRSCLATIGTPRSGATRTDDSVIGRSAVQVRSRLHGFQDLRISSPEPAANAAAFSVSSEILAYQGCVRPAWSWLPVSAVTEMAAVTLCSQACAHISVLGNSLFCSTNQFPTRRSDAENAVKHVEGVEKVDNQIEVLPLSPMDNHIRRQVFVAIYGYPALQKYAMPVVKPIRIIVKNGHVTLEGVVDSDSDKNTAAIRAKSVPGVFSVTDNFQVVRD
jgi:osmotically-inducible protein OsmY